MAQQASGEHAKQAWPPERVHASGAHSSSPARMEPILEETSELAMEIAQAVVEKLDVDRKIDERTKELMQKGDRVFRDLQDRHARTTDALNHAVAECLDSQRTFQEEHQKLVQAVRDLTSILAPLRSPSGSPPNLLGPWDPRAAMAAPFGPHAAAGPAAATPPMPPGAVPGGVFSITLRKADDVSLGLSVSSNEGDEVLHVEGIVPGGAVEAWNRQCFGDGNPVVGVPAERMVLPGDTIVSVNNISRDARKMLEECTKQRLVRLVIARGGGGQGSEVVASAASPAMVAPAPASQGAANGMRTEAPEFVPRQPADVALQQRQFTMEPNEQHQESPVKKTSPSKSGRNRQDPEFTQVLAVIDEDEDKENM